MPLGEDAMGEDRVSCMVVPSTFFWTAVVERGFVDGDSRWVLTFPLDVGVVSLNCDSHFVGLGVEALKVREIRHWIASMSSVIRMEIIAMMTMMMSPS